MLFRSILRNKAPLNKLLLNQRRHFGYTTLCANTNQAQGLAEYAIDFLAQDASKVHESVYDRVRLFHTDSVLCGVSAIAQRTNAPNLFRREAITKFPVNPTLVGADGEK